MKELEILRIRESSHQEWSEIGFGPFGSHFMWSVKWSYPPMLQSP